MYCGVLLGERRACEGCRRELPRSQTRCMYCGSSTQLAPVSARRGPSPLDTVARISAEIDRERELEKPWMARANAPMVLANIAFVAFALSLDDEGLIGFFFKPILAAIAAALIVGHVRMLDRHAADLAEVCAENTLLRFVNAAAVLALAGLCLFVIYRLGTDFVGFGGRRVSIFMQLKNEGVLLLGCATSAVWCGFAGYKLVTYRPD
jgi:hypothetical protein